VSSHDGIPGTSDSFCGFRLRKLTGLSLDNSNLGFGNEVSGGLDGDDGTAVAAVVVMHVFGGGTFLVESSLMVRELREVRFCHNMEVLVAKFGGNPHSVVVSLHDDEVLVSVVYGNMLMGMVVVVHDGSLVGDFIETELAGVLGPVSFSGCRDISSSSVESGVFAQVGGRLGHGELEFRQLRGLKLLEVLSVGLELGQDLLLEVSAEFFLFVFLVHNLFAVRFELHVEVLDDTRFVVGDLCGMELSEVLSSDGSDLLGLDSTSDRESLAGTSLESGIVNSHLFVDDDESHFTSLHGSSSGSSNLCDIFGVSGFV